MEKKKMFDDYYQYNEPYVIYGIDKISLGLETKHLRIRETPLELKGIIDITNYGNWSVLNIQCEINKISYINPFYPLHSIFLAIQKSIMVGIFNEDTARKLILIMNGIYFGYFSPYDFLKLVNETIRMKIDEYELFYDFYWYNPFLKFDTNHFTNWNGTFYTKDYKKIKRKNGESKGARRSILCYYNRGLKIGSDEQISRLEFRICNKRAKSILNDYDLIIPVDAFINTHCDQIRTILKLYIPTGSIKIDNEYIENTVPMLKKLIEF